MRRTPATRSIVRCCNEMSSAKQHIAVFRSYTPASHRHQSLKSATFLHPYCKMFEKRKVNCRKGTSSGAQRTTVSAEVMSSATIRRNRCSCPSSSIQTKKLPPLCVKKTGNGNVMLVKCSFVERNRLFHHAQPLGSSTSLESI